MGLFHKRLDSRSYHTHLISLLKNSELHVRISHLPYWTINRPHRFLKIRHSKEEIACDKKIFFLGGVQQKRRINRKFVAFAINLEFVIPRFCSVRLFAGG